MELDLSKARVIYSYDNKVKDRRVTIPSKLVNQMQERDNMEEKIREVAYQKWLEGLMKHIKENREG